MTSYLFFVIITLIIVDNSSGGKYGTENDIKDTREVYL